MTNKFLPEHRRAFGDFEAVDFVDEQEIAAIRGKYHADKLQGKKPGGRKAAAVP
jgi:hypothetical protein